MGIIQMKKKDQMAIVTLMSVGSVLGKDATRRKK